MKIEVEFFDIKIAAPGKDVKFCLCITDGGYVRTGYHEDGHFWDTKFDDASGIGNVLFWVPTPVVKLK